MLIVISVLSPVVAVVSRVIPVTLPALSAIEEPSAILAVVTVKVTLPAVPAVSVPLWLPTLTLFSNGSLTVRVKGLDFTPSIVTLSEWLPAGVSSLVLIVISVLPPVVAVVSRVIPVTLPALSEIEEPLAILAVVTVKVTLPAVPAASVPL